MGSLDWDALDFAITDPMICEWNTGALECGAHVQMCGSDKGIDYQTQGSILPLGAA